MSQLRNDLSQSQVIRAEVMPPGRDTMRLIHGKQTHAQSFQRRTKLVILESLGRDVQDLEFPGNRIFNPIVLNMPRHRAVDDGCGNAKLLEVIHLVLHQRDQRRHNQRQSGKSERRKLKAKRLTAARGHDAQPVPSPHDEIDHLALCGAKIGEPELFFEKCDGSIHNSTSYRPHGQKRDSNDGPAESSRSKSRLYEVPAVRYPYKV